VTAPVASLRGVHKRFGRLHAIDDIDLDVKPGEVLGVVGESGSGKSTLGRCLLRLLRPSSGRVTLEGQDITEWPERRLRKLRAHMTLVAQDPWAALNPRMSARRTVEEPLLLHTKLRRPQRRAEGERLARRVHLLPEHLDRLPSGLSGGQLQRVCIARAIATRPRLIVLDEPTSSLDLSVRAGIIELLAELRADTGVAMLFITHDLGTLRLIADRIAVLYLGRLIELGPAARVLTDPAHPYTQSLLSAHLPADPSVKPSRIRLAGEIPSPVARPPGCPFATRCPLVEARCHAPPPFAPAGPDRLVACIRVPEGTHRIAIREGDRGADAR